jgi:ATP-binding cassette subfamily F protein uup
VLIAQLMLQPADVLLLDEPTNDLDIPTLEILEETLLEYPGSLVLVTHDRYMLDRIANIVVGLDGEGNAGAFADYAQWEAWLEERERARKPAKTPERAAASNSAGSKKKLSYLEEREWSTIEERIAQAEEVARRHHAEVEDPAVATDAARLQTALAEAAKAQEVVDDLYTRWGELEAKRS